MAYGTEEDILELSRELPDSNLREILVIEKKLQDYIINKMVEKAAKEVSYLTSL